MTRPNALTDDQRYTIAILEASREELRRVGAPPEVTDRARKIEEVVDLINILIAKVMAHSEFTPVIMDRSFKLHADILRFRSEYLQYEKAPLTNICSKKDQHGQPPGV